MGSGCGERWVTLITPSCLLPVLGLQISLSWGRGFCKVSTGKCTPRSSGYKLWFHSISVEFQGMYSQLLPASGHQQPQSRCQLNSENRC